MSSVEAPDTTPPLHSRPQAKPGKPQLALRPCSSYHPSLGLKLFLVEKQCEQPLCLFPLYPISEVPNFYPNSFQFSN